MPYIVNLSANVEYTGGGSSYNVNPSSVTPGSITVNGIWGGRFSHYTINWSVNWDESVNASPSDLPRSPAIPHIA